MLRKSDLLGVLKLARRDQKFDVVRLILNQIYQSKLTSFKECDILVTIFKNQIIFCVSIGLDSDLLLFKQDDLVNGK